jgi:hypothetical protein
MLLADAPKACDPNLEGLQQNGIVKQLGKAFENINLLPEIQKIGRRIKYAHKAFN